MLLALQWERGWSWNWHGEAVCWERLFRLILAASGVAVIVVSSELEEVLGLSHRVLVMSGGRQRDVLDRAEASAESVMQLAVPMAAATQSSALTEQDAGAPEKEDTPDEYQ